MVGTLLEWHANLKISPTTASNPRKSIEITEVYVTMIDHVIALLASAAKAMHA